MHSSLGMAPARLALVGVTGHGASHARRFLELQARGAVRVVAFAEPAPERKPEVVSALREAGAVHCTDLAEFPDSAGIGAVVIATPIHLHHPLALAALRRGWHVLLEKPATATIQELLDLVAAARRAARLVAVNFQHTARPGFRTLLKWVRAGRLGPVRHITGWGVWQRDEVYYRRSWAGRLQVGGRWVLDGTLMNPFAHLVNQVLIAASPEPGRPAMPSRITAELYRTNPIESEDTACARIVTAGGAEVLIFATLAGPGWRLPQLRIDGASGTAIWDYDDRVTLTDGDGRETILPPPPPGPDVSENFLAALRGQPVELYSPLEHSAAHLTAANGAFLSSWPPVPILAPYRRQVRTEQGTLAWTVPGVEDRIRQAARERLLFSELGVEWARPGRTIDLAGFARFAPPEE